MSHELGGTGKAAFEGLRGSTHITAFNIRSPSNRSGRGCGNRCRDRRRSEAG
jgi:hypothetical protein